MCQHPAGPLQRERFHVIAPTRSRSLLTVFAMLVALLALTLMSAQSASAASYKKCALSESDRDPPGEKPTYNLTLKHQKTTCATAKKVMKAFHACRSRTADSCSKKLLSRWTCTGRTTSSIPTQFNASFTCTSGGKRVRGTYQQYT
jgi:hypothetical protein